MRSASVFPAVDSQIEGAPPFLSWGLDVDPVPTLECSRGSRLGR